MDQDTDRRPVTDVAAEPPAPRSPAEADQKPAQEPVVAEDENLGQEPDTDDEKPVDKKPDAHDVRVTRRVHVVLGIVIAAVSAWLLYMSRTELEFRGANNEPGPGYLPVLLTICLIGLGLALAAVWLWGPRARHGDAPTLSLSPSGMGRALLVWLVLVVSAFLIEPLGFLVAGEVLVLLVIIVVERIRSIPLIITLLLLPPAMYFLFDTLLEVQLPGGTLWY
jgi:Tripartite tricarboxylate transporter TctB family